MTQWKRVYFNGEESNYKVAEDSTVINNQGKIIKPISWCSGRYYMYSFNHKGNKVRRLTHRLVAEYFVPLPKGYSIEQLQVNHKDGNHFNNSYTNLEWTTGEENIQHAFDSGLCPLGGTPFKRVMVTNVATGESKEYPSIRQASIDNDISLASLSIKSRKFKEFKHTNFLIRLLQ